MEHGVALADWRLAHFALAQETDARASPEGRVISAQLHQGFSPGQPATDQVDRTTVGITIERVRASIAPSGGARRHPLTLVRFDLSRYRPRLLTARAHGGSRTLDRWVRADLQEFERELDVIPRGGRMIHQAAHHLLDLRGKHLRPL